MKTERKSREPQLTYNYQESAIRLGVSVMTIRRMVAAKQLRTVKVGQKPRIPLEELERFGRSPRGDK